MAALDVAPFDPLSPALQPAHDPRFGPGTPAGPIAFAALPGSPQPLAFEGRPLLGWSWVLDNLGRDDEALRLRLRVAQPLAGGLAWEVHRLWSNPMVMDDHVAVEHFGGRAADLGGFLDWLAIEWPTLFVTCRDVGERLGEAVEAAVRDALRAAPGGTQI